MGLEQLAIVLNSWLKSPAGSPLQPRLALGNLNAQYAQQLAAIATSVRTTAAQAGERVEAKAAAQAGMDREDGIAILLLGQIVRAFETAHDRDPTIPRLLPNSTGRLFSQPRRQTPELTRRHRPPDLNSLSSFHHITIVHTSTREHAHARTTTTYKCFVVKMYENK